MRIEIPLYQRIWWEGKVNDGIVYLMAFDGEKTVILERHENIKVVFIEEEKL